MDYITSLFKRKEGDEGAAAPVPTPVAAPDASSAAASAYSSTPTTASAPTISHAAPAKLYRGDISELEHKYAATLDKEKKLIAEVAKAHQRLHDVKVTADRRFRETMHRAQENQRKTVESASQKLLEKELELKSLKNASVELRHQKNTAPMGNYHRHKSAAAAPQLSPVAEEDVGAGVGGRRRHSKAAKKTKPKTAAAASRKKK